MSSKSLYDNGETIYRVLAENEDSVFVIDCIKRTMPFWVTKDALSGCNVIDESILYDKSGLKPVKEDELSQQAIAVARKRYSIIAPVIAVVADKKRRNGMIIWVSKENRISKQTVRKYLCLYLAFQTITVLAPIDSIQESMLSKEQKWMRWALNKFFYTCRQNSLRTAFLYLLKEKYTDENGLLKEGHPSFYQFRYFYRKTRNEQKFLISRKGLTDYQRNHRPLLGEGVSGFANHVGVAMLDSTICDIYLVDENGNLLGRPILTACVDAYSQICCGFALTWEGGVSSLRELMQNVIANKVELCRKYGVIIESNTWDCCELPGVLMTDRGTEYCSENFEHLAELGVTIINLPSYRPELKGIVEEFFDLVQSYYKPYLKGKGVIEPDYQQRGAHDYRMDACLTLEDFKKVMLRCIVHYNSRRRLRKLNYTQEMIDRGIKPIPCELWVYGKTQPGANLINVNKDVLSKTLLPRTSGKFTRKGLIVNGLRYKHDNYTERFISGGIYTVAYDPSNVNLVWLIEKGNYTELNLIESRYKHKTLDEVVEIQQQVKRLTTVSDDALLQADIDLQQHISAIGDTAKNLHK